MWRKIREEDGCSGYCSLQRGELGAGRDWGLVLESSMLTFDLNRAYALQKHRPLTLHPTIGLPSPEDDAPIPITGFIHLVNLYRHFDDMFVGLWNKSRTDCTTFLLAHLQQELTNALPEHLDTTESQAADLRTSQQWLRTLVWQLSIMNGYLSSTSPDVSMTFKYPIEIARDLISVTSQLSKQSMEVHGIGLVCTLLITPTIVC